VATLFLSSQHHSIIKLFSVGHEDNFEDNEHYIPPFSIGCLALFTTCYLFLMSIGAGLAIPGGLFMPSILVRRSLLPCTELVAQLRHSGAVCVPWRGATTRG
jgi:chloride channel 7